jgi:ribonucleoside-diphosphate reductase alpha chain
MTSVCVIGAMNLNHWDTIKENPQMIKDSFMFLDIMNEEYIKLTEGVPFMEKARKAAMEKRDIGLGAFGFHDLLQSKGFAYGDLASRRLNKEIFSFIKKGVYLDRKYLDMLLDQVKQEISKLK